jgi:hypothetical protein
MGWSISSIANGITGSRSGIVKLLLTLLAAVIGIVTAYHTTIYSIKSELAGKADAEAVAQIDRRLIRIETLLAESIEGREQQVALATRINRRLASIESKLNHIPEK